MENRITVTGPRRLRLPRRRLVRLALVGLAALVVAVPLAWATDRFSDVAATSPHHNDVNTIAGAGITGGCNPPANTLYCPDQGVRRDQMASFLARGLGRVAVSQSLLAPSVTRTVAEAFTPVSEVTIVVGGTGAGATQYVKVDALLNVFDASECPCRFFLRIRDVSTGDVSSGGYFQTIELGQDHTFAAGGVFDAAPGPRTFRLEVWYQSYTGSPPPTWEHSLSIGQAYVVATTYPFLSGSAQIDAAVAPSKKAKEVKK